MLVHVPGVTQVTLDSDRNTSWVSGEVPETVVSQTVTNIVLQALCSVTDGN